MMLSVACSRPSSSRRTIGSPKTPTSALPASAGASSASITCAGNARSPRASTIRSVGRACSTRQCRTSRLSTGRARSCMRCWATWPSRSSRARTTPKEFRRMSEEPKLEELDRLISMGKQKGFLTYDEVNDALPSDIVSLDQLDDIMMMFGAMDIEVVDSAKAARLPSEVARPAAVVEDDDDGGGDAIDLSPGPVGRTEDPVRLYLREMGRVALLTREGEIALAKRIEEGKNQVTVAILSTNLAVERFRELREQLRRHDISVKEVVDVNEEEFTEEKEADLTRVVITAFAMVDRLLRERDKLVAQARKLRLKTTTRRRPKKGAKEPAWKRLESQ